MSLSIYQNDGVKMIAKIRKLVYLPTLRSLFYGVRKNVSLGPLCRLARAWWRGMLPCGKAMREEIEALEKIRDRWRLR
ncbi:MAG: hypothetical protein NT086_08320 [Proteobacteria bacterium]|jgi:hypothetical protein|nr:hypothetical protein [Pseudomonadota bacterium]